MKIGILGGGQLGRLLAASAERIGLDTVVIDPSPSCSASGVARVVRAHFDAPDGAAAWAGCAAVTYESENVPPAALEAVGEPVRVQPCVDALRLAADRVLEKRVFRHFGLETPRHRRVADLADLERAVEEIGLPAVLKVRRSGYDGRGQCVLHARDATGSAWASVGRAPSVLEERVPFDREVSLVAVRGLDGEVRFWSPTRNVHERGMLRISWAPASGLDAAALAAARRGVEAYLHAVEYVGVLAVEFFLVGDRWIANEMACRVHNSGHWTIEGAETSQFENHLRAVAGWPLGPTGTRAPSAMVNLVGRLPDPGRLASVPGAHVHDYHKAPRPGRKIGHVTVTAPDEATLAGRLEALVDRIDDPATHRAWMRLRTTASAGLRAA